MRSIRKNVFETNSSSCHCLTILKPNVFAAISNKEAVLHDKYSDVDEGGSISVTYRSSDLIYVNELHTEFIEEFQSKINTHDIQCYLRNLDFYWTGLSDFFLSNITNIDFFKSLLFFDQDNIIIPNTIVKAPKPENESYEDYIREKSPQWILVWIFKSICYDCGFSYIVFSREFGDTNILISDFSYDSTHDTYTVDHYISC